MIDYSSHGWKAYHKWIFGKKGLKLSFAKIADIIKETQAEKKYRTFKRQ